MRILPLTLALMLSAVTVAGLGTAAVHVVTSTEGGFLQAEQRALQAIAVAAEKDLQRSVLEAQRASILLASDPNMGADLRGLSTALAIPQPTGKLAKAIQARAEAARLLLKQRTETLRRRAPEAQSVAYIDGEGDVLWSDSPYFAVGDNIHGTGKEAVTEPLLRALGGSAQSGVRLSTQAPQVWFWSAEPVFFKGKLAGLTLVETPLRRLPAMVGGQGLLVVEGQIAQGRAPVGYNSSTLQAYRTGQAVLVAQRTVEGRAGAFSMPLWMVDPEHVGVWGARFRVPGTDRAYGVAFADLSDGYRELGEKQVQITVLACMAWAILALLYGFAGWPSPQKMQAAVTAASISTPVSADATSPWSDASTGASAAEDDGYQPLDAFELPSDLAGGNTSQLPTPVDAAAGASSSARRPPAVVLGDILETMVLPQQASPVADSQEGWSDVTVPDIAAAAALEAPAALTDAADIALQDHAPAVSARDDLLAKLKSKSRPQATPTPPLPTQKSVMVHELVEEAQPIMAEADPAEAARTAHYREVFEEFVRLRKTCNEPGVLMFDKFLARLMDTRSAVIAKHHCEDVLFSAYIKNGKAALKATPR